MRSLIDTCVISELNRPRGNARVKKRVAAMGNSELFLSVITVGEIAKGVALVRAPSKRAHFEAFLRQLEQSYGDRVLEVDIEITRIWGDITARAQQQGTTLPACDGLIAATAIRHGLRMITRNVKHFAPTGVMLLDPWDDA